jgi:transposase
LIWNSIRRWRGKADSIATFCPATNRFRRGLGGSRREVRPSPRASSRSDKAFDSNAIVAVLNKRGAKIVISQHPRRAKPLKIDEEMYKWRHLIENFFCKLNEFKRIAMRCDKTDQSFAAMIYLAAAVINSR